MTNTYDVKAGMRKSDEIFDALNRLCDAKQSGSLQENEFSNLIVSIGDVFAKSVENGKQTADNIDSFEAYLTQFLGKNADKYFNFPHSDLEMAAKTCLEGLDIAQSKFEQRSAYAQPVMSAESYKSNFKRLG